MHYWSWPKLQFANYTYCMSTCIHYYRKHVIIIGDVLSVWNHSKGSCIWFLPIVKRVRASSFGCTCFVLRRYWYKFYPNSLSTSFHQFFRFITPLITSVVLNIILSNSYCRHLYIYIRHQISLDVSPFCSNISSFFLCIVIHRSKRHYCGGLWKWWHCAFVCRRNWNHYNN